MSFLQKIESFQDFIYLFLEIKKGAIF